MTPALAQALCDSMRAPFDGSIADWCAQHVDLPASYVPSGLFKPAKSRWLLGPLDALKNDRYRIVNILKPTGTGGTLIGDLFITWRIVNKPGNIQWNWNSDEIATGHAEERINPLFDNCLPVRELTSDNRHEVRVKARKFKTGTWFKMQAATEKRLQAKHIPVQVNDEVWQWDAGRMREADSRLGAYRRVGMSKQLNISQGGDVGSEWHQRCLEGERYEWRVPCPKCGAFFFPQMEQANGGKPKYMCRFDSDGGNIVVICPACDHEMQESDTLKAEWNEGGKYVRLNDGEFTSATFRWSPFVITPWKEIVDEYRLALAARKAGVLLKLRQFIQKVMADFWDEATADVEPVDLKVDDYKPSVTWQVEHKAALTVDCQKNLTLFYVVSRGWASNGESRRLFRGRLNSFDEIASVQKRFNIPSTHVLLDVGYEQTPIIQECARRIDDGRSWGWFGLKGVRDDQGAGFAHTHPNEPFGKHSAIKKKRIYSENIWPDMELGQRNHNVEQWLNSLSPHARSLYANRRLKVPIVLWSNRLIYEILTRLRDGRGAPWLAPTEEAGQDEEKLYREQMAAKILKDGVDSRGNPSRHWESIRPNYPDHYWDCECEQIVFASMAGALIGV